jgi:hypothetical protein
MILAIAVASESESYFQNWENEGYALLGED